MSQTNDDREALDHLYSIVYEQLRRLANGVLRKEYVAEMSATTLVNEAWLKLVKTPDTAKTSPVHFRAIAGRAMRQILVDAARRRQAQINGGDLLRIEFDPALVGRSNLKDTDLLSLDVALDQLKEICPRQAELVEAKFFGGFSWGECAEMLDISEATAMRDWKAARAWLGREIRQTNKALSNSTAPKADAHGTGSG